MEKINILFYQKSGCTCQVARKSIDWWKPFLRPSALHPSRECFKSFHFDPHLLPASCSITIGNKTLWINVYFFFYFLLFRLPPIITNIDRTLTGKSILILSPYGNHFATPVALSKVRELKKLCWGEKKTLNLQRMLILVGRVKGFIHFETIWPFATLSKSQ